MNRYTLGPMVFGGAGGQTLHQLPDRSYSNGITLFENNSAGKPDRGFVAIAQSAPVISGASLEISRFFKLCNPLKGLSIPSAAPNPVVTSLDIYYYLKEEFSDRKADSGFRVQVRSADGTTVPGIAWLVPRQLTAEHAGEARVTYELHAFSTDGKKPRWAFSTTASYPVTVPAEEKFTLGPVLLQGVELDSNIRMTWDFGIETEKVGSGSSVSPMSGGVKRRRPRVSVSTLDMRSLSTYGITGTVLTADAEFWLVKIKENSDRYDPTDAVHVLLTCYSGQGIIVPMESSGGDNDDQSVGIDIVPVIGTNPILAVTVDTDMS